MTNPDLQKLTNKSYLLYAISDSENCPRHHPKSAICKYFDVKVFANSWIKLHTLQKKTITLSTTSTLYTHHMHHHKNEFSKISCVFSLFCCVFKELNFFRIFYYSDTYTHMIHFECMHMLVYSTYYERLSVS